MVCSGTQALAAVLLVLIFYSYNINNISLRCRIRCGFYRACYGLYGLDFLILGIEPIASGMPGTALPLGHTTALFSFGDRVLLRSPKLILNLLCSPRMLQRIVVLQISQTCGCTCDWTHLILFSPSSQFSLHGLLHL